LIPFAASLACVAFIIMFRWLGIAKIAKSAMEEGRHAAAVLGAKEISEDQKESQIRQASLNLFGVFVQFTGRAGAALVVPFIILFVLDLLGLAAMNDVLALLLRWEIIAGMCALAICAAWLRR